MRNYISAYGCHLQYNLKIRINIQFFSWLKSDFLEEINLFFCLQKTVIADGYNIYTQLSNDSVLPTNESENTVYEITDSFNNIAIN